MTRILFAGGGSIGHIAPSVAVWRAIRMIDPAAEAHFVCSQKEDDATFLQEEGIAFTPIRAPRLGLALPYNFPSALHAGMSIVGRFQPDVVFCKGGSISVPIGIAARTRSIPMVLHESDAVSGYANRLLSRWATIICDGFPSTENRQAATKNRIFTGNPIRPDITSGSRDEGLRITGLSGKRPVLLVLGGSQGAAALNEVITAQMDRILQHCDIIHLTGRGKENGVRRAGYWSVPFAHAELPHLYALASVALSRAGAGSIAELAGNGIPALLVPLRGVGHDHQQYNALSAAAGGGCLLLPQERLAEELLATLSRLLADAAALRDMRERIRRLASTDAAGKIAGILLGSARKTS